MHAYITSTGAFLPGPAIDNSEIENILGQVNNKPSRLKNRILKSNGIKTRHYAIDAQHKTLYSNEDLAVNAALNCLERSPIPSNNIAMLSCATTQGDMILPGFGSMVQAGIGIPDIELHTSHGICSSSLMALKVASNALRLDDHANALVIASELVSRLFKNTRYECVNNNRIDFNAEFLRWMLSDGAGAMLLENKPRNRCLRIDWIRSFSHADAYPVCMGVGKTANSQDQRSWQDFPDYASAEKAGAIMIRQDVRLLENIVKLGVDGALRLIDQGMLNTDHVDHFLCHYSSHYFRSKIFQLLEVAGISIPEEKWYTNLYARGNTGCASIFIMLDEFWQEQRAKPGETILCMVPESGRFNTAYMHLTVVE